MLRSDIQREFCKALRSLTFGKCGKIAEKCEPKENLNQFRNTHQLNVAEALNKFIFGNAKLYTNNFVKTDQCNHVDIWQTEKESEKPVGNFGSNINRGYSNVERKIIPGVIQPPFSDVGRSKKLRIHSSSNVPTHPSEIQQYSLYRIKNKRRQLFTKSPKNSNHTNCNVILRQNLTPDISNIPFLCKQTTAQLHPQSLNSKQDLDDSHDSYHNDSKLINIRDLKNKTITSRITNKIPFENLKTLLLEQFNIQNNSIDQNHTSFLPHSVEEARKSILDSNNGSFLIRNNLTGLTKIGESLLETSNDDKNVWILENNEIVTEEPVFFADKSLQQPLKSKGLTLNMAPFLRFGEIGIIIYQILYGAL